MSIKIACHIHSEWSYDGSWSLARLSTFFSKRGYKAILLSEHDRDFNQNRLNAYRKACVDASTCDILLIPGIEYSDPTNTIHVLTWGNIPFFGEKKDTLGVLEHVKKHNGIAILAHPSRKMAWKDYDERWNSLLKGIELWNRKSDGIRPSPDAIILQRKTQLPGIYGLDFHRINHYFPLAITLTRQVEEPDESFILDCFHSEAFTVYALGLERKTIESTIVGMGLGLAENFRKHLFRVFKPTFTK